MTDCLDPNDEDNYDNEYEECFYEEPSDEPMWEPNEYYTDPMYGSDTY
jgi:hypothetical protein